MTQDASAEGKAAYSRQEPVSACPYPAGSTESQAWVSGWTAAEAARTASPAEPAEQRADAPFLQARGLTGAELADVIGADDYEAGADDVPPGDKGAA